LFWDSKTADVGDRELFMKYKIIIHYSEKDREKAAKKRGQALKNSYFKE
jgi:hypothetical protein